MILTFFLLSEAEWTLLKGIQSTTTTIRTSDCRGIESTPWCPHPSLVRGRKLFGYARTLWFLKQKHQGNTGQADYDKHSKEVYVRPQ